jgi:hypothetical protein
VLFCGRAEAQHFKTTELEVDGLQLWRGNPIGATSGTADTSGRRARDRFAAWNGRLP